MEEHSFDMIEKMLDRQDNYVRHFFTALVSWFTFFISVNWVTLGWIAKGYSESREQSGDIGAIVGDVFTWHCILGIAICAASAIYFRRISKQVRVLEEELKVASKTVHPTISAFPVVLYVTSAILMILGISPFVWIWQTIL